MGIGTIVAAALKRVPWTSLAMNYGPEIFKKLKVQIRPHEEEEDVSVFAEAAAERIRQLEKLAAEQERVLQGQQERLQVLEDACRALEARVRLFRLLFAASAVAAVVLLGLLLSR